nr:nascent polypeptide-associated complex subunit alpha, muscle-specific form-like [Penaeus vannamei]
MEPAELPSFISTFFSMSPTRPAGSPTPTPPVVLESEPALALPSQCAAVSSGQDIHQVHCPASSPDENEGLYFDQGRHPSSWHDPSAASPASCTPWYYPSSPIPHSVHPSPATESHPSSTVHVALPSLKRIRPSPIPNTHARVSPTHYPPSPTPYVQPTHDREGYPLSRGWSSVLPCGGPAPVGILSQCSPTDGYAGTDHGSRAFKPPVDRSRYCQQVSPGPSTPTGSEPAPVNHIRSDATQVSGWNSAGAAVLQSMPPVCTTPTRTPRGVECDPYNFISSPRYESIPTTPSLSSSSASPSPLPNQSLHFQTYVKTEASTTPAARPPGTRSTFGDHLPVPMSLYSNGLRKMGWCEGFCPKKGRKTSMVCSTCGVMLCLDCYATYHRADM